MSLFLNFFGLLARAAAHSYEQDWGNIGGHSHVEKLDGSGGVDFVKRQKAVLLFFYSKNCSYCDTMKPEVAQAAAELSRRGSSIRVAAVESVVFPAIPKYFGVKAVPTLNLYQNGQFVVEYIWRRKAADIIDFLEKSQA